MRYRVTKTYGHERGFSAAFRQHKASSHCKYVHGYALAFVITFEAEQLDERGWVVDFGDLGEIKDWLETTFDHVTLVATDDPHREAFVAMSTAGLMRVCIVPATGCEAFARMTFLRVSEWLRGRGHSPRVNVASVSVMEHGSNRATVVPDRVEIARG